MSEEYYAEEARKRAREGRGAPEDHVFTEAEKYDRKRKADSPPPATQLEMEEEPTSSSSSADEVQMRGALREPSAAGKGPLNIYAAEEVSSSSHEEKGNGDADIDIRVPDLHRYFEQFDVADDAVVSMCRAYASYLASQSKKKLQGCLPKRRRKEAQEQVSQKAKWAASKKRPPHTVRGAHATHG